LDQLIRSWLFATISPESLTEAHDVIHSKKFGIGFLSYLVVLVLIGP